MALIHGFELIKEQQIKELNINAFLYKHLGTGAELLSLVSDDENKVFGITFRTPPSDSTGVAHILEHSVLCGSKKYRVKEPFVELLKSSLQTFLNAMTYPDKTCYPVASQNLKDFYNLIDVYLDAVFYPRLTPHIFEQEGWHYEVIATNRPMTVKGVVFNEMKGAYSSPDYLLSHHSQKSLFPDNVYSLDPGGDPKEISKLTYDKFYEFHTTYYHPANSRIYFYGNDDPEERLRLINAYLKKFKKSDVPFKIDLQKKFESPAKIVIPFAADCDEKQEEEDLKGMITFNWLLGDTTDIKMNFAMQILSYILIGMPASALRKALIESGLGEGLAGVGLETELRQMYFSVGLKGIDVTQADLVEDLIDVTFFNLLRSGLDPLIIEAAFNSVEFALRENNTGSFPRGLSLMFRALTTWLYDADPMGVIAFEEPFNEIKNQYASNPSLFEEMIDTFFVKNSHRAVVILKPDINIGKKEAASEQTAVSQKRIGMTMKEVKYLIDNTSKLKKLQEKRDSDRALGRIPSLKLSEIDKKNKDIPCIREEGEVKYYYHDISTNGILYFDIGFCLNVLPQKYLPYAVVFGRALVELGTDREDYVKFSLRISRKTGGISTSYFSSIIKDTENPATWLFLRSKAMMHQADDLMSIFRDMLLSVNLNSRHRIRQIVLELKSGLEQNMIPGGNRIVSLRIHSHFNKAAWADEHMAGINSLFFLRELAERIDNKWRSVLSDMEEIRRILITKSNMIINATIDEKNWPGCRELTKKILERLPAEPSNEALWLPENPPEFEGLLIPSQVNYVGKGANIYSAGYKYNGSINVIMRFLRTNYLWERVRVQGGAYGVMNLFNRMSGVLTFVSYRDPGIRKTLDAYDNAALFLKNISISEKELHRNIIGAIGDIDAYMLPDAKGYASLLWALNGNTDAVRQEMREQVLETSVSDFKAFADVLDYVREKGIVKIMGGEIAFIDAWVREQRPPFLKVL